MPRAGRRSPSPRSPRASKARRPSAGSGKRRAGKRASAGAATVTVTARQALWLELMPFYIHEAWLLDERRFKEWLDLFTDDVLYFMPRRKNVLRREAHREVTPLGDLSLIEDDRRYLEMRVARLDTGMAWGEDPPSRTRPLIGSALASRLRRSARELGLAQASSLSEARGRGPCTLRASRTGASGRSCSGAPRASWRRG